MNLTYPFTSNPQRHEGVRPFNIWGLRLFYFLMLVFVVPDAWHGLLTHQGPWDPLRAVAVFVCDRWRLNSSRSALNCSWCVLINPCGAPAYTFSVAPLIIFEERRPLILIGTI